MKVFIKPILVCCITVFLFACQKQNNFSKAEPNREIVSIETAREVAIGFAQSKLTQQKIEAEETVADNGNPYFHVFNFKEKGGFVIVSAEKNEHPILAYSEKGEFIRKNAPYGIVYWIETTKESIDQIRQGKFDTKKQTTAEWAQIGRDYKIARLQNEPEDPACREYSTSDIHGPFLQTNWGQGCGYNDLVPANSSGLRCGHFPTGCVATAMAQVMRFWSFPSGYTWASMPNNWSDNEVARVMRDAGTSVGMNYNDNGSGANHNNIAGALINTFGYGSAQGIDYNGSYWTIQSEINQGRPVILSGYNQSNSSWFGLVVEYNEGHEWVCDGFNETNIYYCINGQQYGNGYLQFHMNWGWDGNSNGWYGFDSWAPTGTGLNFQYYKRAIINLHP